MADSRTKGIFREFRREAPQHFIIPFLVGFIFECGFTLVYDILLHRVLNYYEYLHPIHERIEMWHDAIQYKLIIFAIRIFVIGTAVFLAYLWIMSRRLNEEGKFAFNQKNVNILNAYLKNAESCFAVSVMDLRTWFVPSSIKYFLQLNEYKDSISFERVLLFLRKDQMAYAEDHFMGKDAAELFASWHRESNKSLSYLQSIDVEDLLRSLDGPTQKFFHFGWLRRIQVGWLRRIQAYLMPVSYDDVLDFALITSKKNMKGQQKTVVLRTDKSRKIVKVKDDDVQFYQNLVDKIKETVYIVDDDGNPNLQPEFDFSVLADRVAIKYALPMGKDKKEELGQNKK